MSSVVDSWRRKAPELDGRSQAAAGGVMKAESRAVGVSPQNKGLRRQSTLSEVTISMLMDRFAPC
ncbi:unnamed protein product [Spirodela intermedia]|uniref:Uncharacterized protein n=1 Tax=Spirodela intermedia TaxID=51605 RepID=A0A7I8INN1_SPIIN|nr:unnamed protein product [Spirodela intermedia]CAA6659565.1 unnamed protein product [Spirodela intermedia]